MTDQPSQQRIATQRKRRIVYSLNVLVAVLVAIAIVVLINWIAYRQYQRFDLTATRKYSLADQTRKVLGQLEGDHRIVTMLQYVDPATVPYIDQMRDLVDEFGRHSDKVQVDHIRPDLDLAKREALYSDVRQRFADDIQPVADAVDQGLETLTVTHGTMTELLPQLQAVAEQPGLSETAAGQFASSVAAALARFGQTSADLQERIDNVLDSPMPGFEEARSALLHGVQTGMAAASKPGLPQLATGLFGPSAQRARKIADEADAPAQVKNDLLVMARRFEALQAQIDQAVEALQTAPAAERYTYARQALLESPGIVILGPEQVRVVPQHELVRVPEQTRPGQPVPELRFLGEERLTGAFVSMAVEEPPLAVFVFAGQRPAIGQGGQFELVAERLRRANYQVTQWNASGQFTTMGQQTPAAAPPQPRQGQRAVWILTPLVSSNALAGATGKEPAADLLKRRLAAGDSALVMLAADPTAGVGPVDPVVDILSNYGIQPQLDRIILKQVQLPDRQSQTTTQLTVDDWPGDLPVGQAVEGMRTVLLQASPLELDTKSDDAQIYPLVRVQGDNLWAHSDLSDPAAVQQAKFDPALHQDAFIVGAAAERENSRVIVVADPVWASDHLTNVGALGQGTAEITGAVFPGNAELFVNSVYWLTGFDELIAASPRSQDIRRIQPISRSTVQAYQWGLFAGMPAVIAVVGVGVWVVRRRG